MFELLKARTKFQTTNRFEIYRKEALNLMFREKEIGYDFLSTKCVYICSEPLHFQIGKIGNIGDLLISGLSESYFNKLTGRNNLILYFHSEIVEEEFLKSSTLEFEESFNKRTKAVGTTFSRVYLEKDKKIEISLDKDEGLSIPIRFFFKFYFNI